MASAQQTLSGVFGAPGLQQFMPAQGSSLTDILGQLGVNVPAPLQGMGADQIKNVLGVQKSLTAAAPATFNTYFSDPGKVASFATAMWKEFNSMLEQQGAPPIGIVQFVQAAGFNPQVQQMFQAMFGGGGDMGGGAQAALGGALGQ